MTDLAALVGLVPANPAAFLIDEGTAAEDLRVELGIVNGDLTPDAACAILEVARSAATDGRLTAKVVGAGVLGHDVVLHLSSEAITEMTETLADVVDGTLSATLTVGTPTRSQHWESMIVAAIAMVGTEVEFDAVTLDLGFDDLEVALAADPGPLPAGSPVMWFDGTQTREGSLVEWHGTEMAVVNSDGTTLEVDLDRISRRTDGQFYRRDQPRDDHGRWVDGPGNSGGPAPVTTPTGKPVPPGPAATYDGPPASEVVAGRPTNPRRGMGDIPIPLDDILKGQDHGRNSAAAFLDPETGGFTEERQRLHDQIVAEALAGHAPNPSGVKTMVMLGGGPAAGKSTAVNAGLIDLPEDYVSVDPDGIKGILGGMGKQVYLDYPGWGGFSHEESSYLAKRIIAASQELGLDYVHDGTGDNDIDKLTRKVLQAEALGYRSVGRYITAPTEVAVERAKARAKREGRDISETVVRETHSIVSRNAIPTAEVFDDYSVYDTTDAQLAADGSVIVPPVKIAEKIDNGTLNILDEERWRTFLNKGNETLVAAGGDPEFVSAEDLAAILVDLNAGIPKDQATIPLNRRASILWDLIAAEMDEILARGGSIEVPSEYPDLTDLDGPSAEPGDFTINPDDGSFRFRRDQPRVPAGSSAGGQWAGGGGSGGDPVVGGKHPDSIVSRIVERLNRSDASPVTDGPSPVLHRKLVMPRRASRTQIGPEGVIPRPGRRGHGVKTTVDTLRVGDTLYSDENTPAGKITKIDKRWVDQGGHIEVHTDRSKIPWGFKPGETVHVSEADRRPVPTKDQPYPQVGNLDEWEAAHPIRYAAPRPAKNDRRRAPFPLHTPSTSLTINQADIGRFADQAHAEIVKGVMRWQGPLVTEGVPSGDGRSISVGALKWRQLPLTLMCMFRNADGGDGHAAALAVGRIDKLWRPENTPNVIWGSGVYADTPEGRKAFEMMRDKFLRGVSVDLCALQVDSVAGRNGRGTLHITGAEIMGATQCAFPAFAEAWLEVLDDQTLVAAGGQRIEARFHSIYDGTQSALVASAGAAALYPVRPPRAWFDMAPNAGYTPVRVSAEGRVWGHVADWAGCHIGWGDRCVPPPRSHCHYSEFRKGEVLCDDGSFVQTGPIVTNTVHPDLAMAASDAQAFYHDTGCVVADVVVYEDAYGIAVAGAVRPDASEIQVRALRGGDFSPDWRPMLSGPSRGYTEMCALLTVNNSGFKVPLSLVAAGGGNIIVPGSGTYARVDLTTGTVLAMVASSGPHREIEQVEQVALLSHEIEALSAQINRLRANNAISKIGA